MIKPQLANQFAADTFGSNEVQKTQVGWMDVVWTCVRWPKNKQAQ
jgi:hypothetical protein